MKLKCNKCNIIFDDLSLFVKDSSRKMGYKNWCKKCTSIASKERYRKNPQKTKKKQKERYAKDKASGAIKHRKLANPVLSRSHELRHGMVNRNRADGIEFDSEYFTSSRIMSILTEQKICLCCGVEFDYSLATNNKKNDKTASADRLLNEKGYTKENVRFICWRCNRLKNDATFEEIEIIVNWLENRSNEDIRDSLDRLSKKPKQHENSTIKLQL